MTAAKQYEDYEAWQELVKKRTESLLGLGDIWDEDDPYDLFESARAAFADDITPEHFVAEMFADDIASRENDALMEAEALEHPEEELDEGPEDDFPL